MTAAIAMVVDFHTVEHELCGWRQRLVLAAYI